MAGAAGAASGQPVPAPATGPRSRAARAGDVEALRAVEVASNARFSTVGMGAVAEFPAMSADEWSGTMADGLAWVETDDADVPVAFVAVRIVDGMAHIGQMSVLPAVAGRGIGARLIERAAAWARERGLAALTLTTFVDVPWNAPYYQRHGFRALADDEAGPGLRALAVSNDGTCLGRWPRTAMRRDL